MRALTGAVALVTGASRGIGKGCALALGAAGATVYVTARTVHEDAGALPGSLDATAAEIEREGGRAVAVRCDHANDEEVDALFAQIARDEGHLEVVVNNAFRVPAHMDPKVPFWETPLSDWNVVERVVTDIEQRVGAGDVRLVDGVDLEMVLHRWGFRVLGFFAPDPSR